MHMADALITPVVAGTMYACSTITTGYSIKKLHLESDNKKVPLMGIMGAFVFATQMINFTIPGTGSSGHLCGGMLLSALLGPYAGFLSMIGVLLIQCLLFADGGILALGANIWNMAFYSCFIGALCIWRPLMKGTITRKKIIIASVLGSVLTLQLGAFSVTLETLASGITELPFTTFVAAMQPIHLLIGLVEGVITAAVLCFVFEARPELLWGMEHNEAGVKNRLSVKKTLLILAIAAVVAGGALSLVASSNPDGLEWSIEKVTGSTELEKESTLHNKAQSIQDTTAVLPDYAFKDSESPVGTSVSGVVGGTIVVAFLMGICYLIKGIRKKSRHE